MLAIPSALLPLMRMGWNGTLPAQKDLLRHCTRIAVPVPSTADITCHIDAFDIETLVEELLNLVNTTEASTNDQRVEVLGLDRDSHDVGVRHR